MKDDNQRVLDLLGTRGQGIKIVRIREIYLFAVMQRALRAN